MNRYRNLVKILYGTYLPTYSLIDENNSAKKSLKSSSKLHENFGIFLIVFLPPYVHITRWGGGWFRNTTGKTCCHLNAISSAGEWIPAPSWPRWRRRARRRERARSRRVRPPPAHRYTYAPKGLLLEILKPAVFC